MNKLAYLLLLPLLSAAPGHVASPDRALPRSEVPLRAGTGESLRPVRWTLVGGSQARLVTTGRTVPITVQADIARGWHIYSLTQKPGGPIPLRLELLGAGDVVVRGVVNAPKPERMLDNNFGIETELYSGSPRFTIPLGDAGRSAPGVRKVQVAARYQVCSDKLCLPPRTDKLDVTLRIASRR
ncbi:MAG TPA: protein-disulfide reductase DsbD N-terminal domain-containing protein [Gemmatimonadaceae bacterium]|nr:protein-disulfide reductase DsbD N-terminal domain-containing protein [Gemmatimonadaceae bacterium]